MNRSQMAVPKQDKSPNRIKKGNFALLLPAADNIEKVVDNSVGNIETTSQIVIDNDKMSDMSFQLNINEIIGSIDEKSELQKMKEELISKDQCIKELLRKIEQLDRAVGQFKDQKSREYTTASSGGNNHVDSSLI